MELIKVISCCCLLSILLTDVVLASPVRSRAIAEAERLEYAIEEGLAVYRAETKRRRRYRRRTNSLIAAIRICRNYRHYPRERIPAHCRNLIRHTANRYHENGPTIVIIEK